jgi:hypothetical protein
MCTQIPLERRLADSRASTLRRLNRSDAPIDKFWRDFIRALSSKSKVKPVLTEYTWQSSSNMIEAVKRIWAAVGLRSNITIDMGPDSTIKKTLARQHQYQHPAQVNEGQ